MSAIILAKKAFNSLGDCTTCKNNFCFLFIITFMIKNELGDIRNDFVLKILVPLGIVC